MMADPLDTGITAAITAALVGGLAWARERTKGRANVERSQVIADERIAPALLARIAAQDLRLDEYRAEMDRQRTECDRHRAEDREACDREIRAVEERHAMRIAQLEDHIATIAGKTRRALDRLRVPDEVEWDGPGTDLHELEVIERTVRRTPTPPDRPAVLEEVRLSRGDRRREEPDE